LAEDLPARIATLTSMQYRNPDQLDQGGVLVVGASATGTQLADEIHRSGRPVTMSVGEHIRMPRMYRGKDISWWMDTAGVWDERYDEVEDIVRARRVPSLQLTGSLQRTTLDLNALTSIGVKLVGRWAAIGNGKALFSGSLKNQCALSDLKMGRLLDAVDLWARENGQGEEERPERLPPTRVEDSPPLSLDLNDGSIRTIIWATGYRPDYSWLKLPVLDRKGHIRHDGGVVDSPGLYLMGMQFLRRRKSALIDGAGDDARDLSAHLASYLDGKPADLQPRDRRKSIRESI
jgi:putative flavoprotein involved in K+ transport